MPIDTMNKFFVSSTSRGLAIMNPPKPGMVFSEEDALLLAAYLVAMSDGAMEKFKEVFEAVCNA